VHDVDFNNNYTSLVHGHAYPPVVEAVIRQAPLGTAFAFATEQEVKHSRALCERVPGFDKLRFMNSGSEAILAKGAKVTIPPRRNARLSTAKDPPPFRAERDAVIQRVKKEGRYPWRTSSGATRQSLAENAVSRFKALLGVKLAAREFGNQQVDALVKCRVLNRMSALGLPISERILQG
jgi:hypothetical protein